MTHLFEVQKEEFDQIKLGQKSFILLKKDRPYKPKDRLIIQELDGENLTSEEIEFDISVVEAQEGIKSNYCILGIIKLINLCQPNEH